MMRRSRLLGAAALIATSITVTGALAQSGIKDEWMGLCTRFPGQSGAYCDCTFDSVGGRMGVDEMRVMIRIVEAAATGDPAVFATMANQLGLTQEDIGAWDTRMQSLFGIAERECAAFGSDG